MTEFVHPTRATSILPITAGAAVAGMRTTAGVLFELGDSKGVAVSLLGCIRAHADPVRRSPRPRPD